MNEVKLTDFKPNTLSMVSEMIMKRVNHLENNPTRPYAEQVSDIDDLLEFNVQVLTAFSIVQERERVLNS